LFVCCNVEERDNRDYKSGAREDIEVDEILRISNEEADWI